MKNAVISLLVLSTLALSATSASAHPWGHGHGHWCGTITTITTGAAGRLATDRSGSPRDGEPI